MCSGSAAADPGREGTAPAGQLKSRWVVSAVLGVTLLFYLFLAWALPYCPVDDFQWGLEQGVRWWREGLLNGRYAGNLVTLLMCHFEPLKVLMMGGAMFAIPFVISILACRGDREKFLPIFLLVNPLILIMPTAMWVDVYGWVSGFGIYGVSAALFLAFLLLARQTYQRRSRLKLRSAALFALALFMGMFVENHAVLFVGVTLVLGVYASIWDRPMLLPFWAAFAGAVLAAVVMFSNAVVADLAASGTSLNGLRKLVFDPQGGLLAAIAGIWSQYSRQVLPSAMVYGAQQVILMAAIIALGFWNSRFRVLSLLAVLPPVTHYMIVKVTNFYAHSSPAVLLCWILVGLALAACRGDRELRVRRILLFLVAPLDLLPLAATDTMGYRFYFLPVLVLVLLTADLAAPLLTRRAGTCLAAVTMAVTLAVFTHHAAVEGGCTVLRNQLVRQAAAEGADTVVLPADRYGAYIYRGRNPVNEEYGCYFRWFYGLPDDVTLVILPRGSYEVWPNYTQEQLDQGWVVLPYSGEFKSSLP